MRVTGSKEHQGQENDNNHQKVYGATEISVNPKWVFRSTAFLAFRKATA
jgi:hypothetical protein